MPQKKRSKDLNFLEKIYLPEIFNGLMLTLKNMFRPNVTMQYPEQKFIPPASYRGRPVLVKENDDTERCVACGLCSRVCPALAIEVQPDETALEKERFPKLFEINMLRCIFCGFCEEVCPEEAIVMSKDYELVYTNREDAIYGKDKLLVPVEELSDRLEFLRNFK
ncbi:MAG: NADH-quinone oxidoreductase subunit NuoI [Melioribacteraceae bacterium]|nr:NADH-quinone oxidoreductase subunit NuoI [Melioribacteraceae bacterium]MCF8263522.1 NADH-quinone oxidoreductase subunit NuoI [Melioribacteraceae bacterium]MCF8411894.1 NADH-quinone oxidoreductase subunit NuoI [Melioribacteraceae bacterium]